jgi:hypothetical protein
MSKESYSEKLKDPRWQAKRKHIVKRDQNKCRKCKESDLRLNVHHIIYIDNIEPWEYDDRYLITLCDKCHEQQHKDIDTESCIKDIMQQLVYITNEPISEIWKTLRFWYCTNKSKYGYLGASIEAFQKLIDGE